MVAVLACALESQGHRHEALNSQAPVLPGVVQTTVALARHIRLAINRSAETFFATNLFLPASV
jgi:hypothetical protein